MADRRLARSQPVAVDSWPEGCLPKGGERLTHGFERPGAALSTRTSVAFRALDAMPRLSRDGCSNCFCG